ncbi:hypothetical protein NQZ68_008300 [Dissostichus eleginoides]|nr:hypothetical protein NQZ68_008300 [Dissostichus eleginoides]
MDNPNQPNQPPIRAIFEMEFPKLESLNGDWLFYKATEFSKMPKSTCRKCGLSMPLQLLGIHLEECRDYNAESDEFGNTDTDEVLLVSSSKETVVEVISFITFP